MADRYLLESGAPDGYLLEDGSGVLLLEAAASPTGSVVGYFKRKNSTHRRRVSSPYLASTPLAATQARAVNELFKTNVIRSRRLISPVWADAMAQTVSAPVVPAAAWFRPVRPVNVLRKPLARKLLVAPDMQWQYIAPLMAAILPRAKVIRIRFDKKAKVPTPLSLYPATPATGPPYPSWKAVAAIRVSHNKRLARPRDQASYPATPVLSSTFVQTLQAIRRKSDNRGFVVSPLALGIPGTPVSQTPTIATVLVRAIRRALDNRGFTVAPLALGIPGTSITVAPIPATDLERANRRRNTKRSLRKTPAAPVYPPASAPPSVPSAAIVPTRARRRSNNSIGFLMVDVLVGEPVPPTTPATYPSHRQTGYIRRDVTKYRIKEPLEAPVYPATPAPGTSDERTVHSHFQTQRVDSRKLKRVQVAPVFPATPPPPPPAMSSFTPVKTIRRNKTGRRIVSVKPVYAASISVATYPSYVPQGFLRRSNTERQLRELPILSDSPQTPPTPPQPVTALQLPKLHLRDWLKRQLLVATGPLHVEAAPPPVVVPVVHQRGGRRASTRAAQAPCTAAVAIARCRAVGVEPVPSSGTLIMRNRTKSREYALQMLYQSARAVRCNPAQFPALAVMQLRDLLERGALETWQCERLLACISAANDERASPARA